MRVSIPGVVGVVAATSAAVLLVVAGAGLASGAPAPAKSDRSARRCFLSREVANFAAPDDQTLFVRVGARDVYRVDVFGGCRDIDWTLRIGIKSYGGGDWLCVGDQAELFVPNRTIGPQRCPIRIGEKLTPEQVAALPKKSRP